MNEAQTTAINILRGEFAVPKSELQLMMRDLQSEMQEGLRTENHSSSIKMLPTYVYHLPTGQEKGVFLAIDLGGSNFRVLRLALDGHGHATITSERFDLTEHHKTTDAETLFGYLADCVRKFEPLTMDANHSYSLGFTFSFPVKQHSIKSGYLIHWTKSFTASGCVNEDPVVLLENAFKARQMNVTVAALINDTVGTMMARVLEDRDCRIGLILGTGTNACYYEQISKIGKWNPSDPQDGGVIINMEWGGFGTNRKNPEGLPMLPYTKYDEILNNEVPPIHAQCFEKMISGNYQGELVRQICLDLIRQNLIFSGHATQQMNTPHGLDTAVMADIAKDDTEGRHETKRVLHEKLGYETAAVNLVDCLMIQEICHFVSRRAARLTGAAISALILQIGGDSLQRCTVAVDGSVFQKYPQFEEMMQAAIHEVADARFTNVKFALAENGSGKGAGLVVASAVCREANYS